MQPLLRWEQPDQQVGKGCLAGARCAGNADDFARRDGKTEFVNAARRAGLVVGCRVHKGDVFEGDRSVERRQMRG